MGMATVRSARKSRTSVALLAAVAAVVLSLAWAAAAQASWGAIAVDAQTGKSGYSFGYDSVGGAKRRARHECGPHCVFAVAVRNGYAALVRKQNGVFVAGVGRNRHIAFRNARHRAHEQAAHRVTWVYSG
jgi:hypothetical protein